MRKKFIALRAYRALDNQPKKLGWLIGERPAREQEGDWKYYFSDLPKAAPLEKMVEYAHRRFLIDQFHEEAKQLLGWNDYQGRLWTGFHRHATLVMLTHSFLCWQEWKQRQETPRSPGRPRDPFSPSKRSKAMLAGSDPSSGRRGSVEYGGRTTC